MKDLLRAGAFGLALAAVAAPAVLAQPAPAAAEAAFRSTTLTLAAYGEAKVAPDMALITLGVQNEAPSAAQAMQANAEQMTRVVAALRRAGLPERDIRTAQLSVNPQYVYQPNQPPHLSGYQASNQVTVTARDLKRLGQTVDAAVGAGATNVNGISFGLVDPTTAQNAARQAAVKALQAKADLYAQATGYRIVRLVNLTEGVAETFPPPPRPLMRMATETAAVTPVSPGEETVRIDVTGMFELAR